jgi:membrane protein YdbS with pleckstrin-like domain
MSQQRFWQQLLLPDERVLHTFGRSRVFLIMYWFLPAIAAAYAAWYFYWHVSEAIAWLLVMTAVILLGSMAYQWLFIHYCVTNRRVMGREGMLWKKLTVVDLRQITDITVSEPFFERLVSRSGTVAVNTAGHHGIELYLSHIPRPFKKKVDLYRHIHKMIKQAPEVQENLI